MESLHERDQERKLEGLKKNLKCQQRMLKLILKTFQIKSRKPARESVGLFADKSVKGALRDDKVKKLSEQFCISLCCWRYLEKCWCYLYQVRWMG